MLNTQILLLKSRNYFLCNFLLFIITIIAIIATSSSSPNGRSKMMTMITAQTCDNLRTIVNISTLTPSAPGNVITISGDQYSVSPTSAFPYLTIQGELKYGQTLIVDGIVSPNENGLQNCTGVDLPLLLCPGSTLIVRNSNVRTIHITNVARPDYAENQCANFCGFPTGVNFTNLQHDDPTSGNSYVVNIQIYNNTVHQNVWMDSAILFESLPNFDCVAFNNTRFNFKIFNNNIQFYSGHAIILSLPRIQTTDDVALASSLPKPIVFANYFRGVLVRNNNASMISCRDGLTAPARKFL